jgi:hypothetical protein
VKRRVCENASIRKGDKSHGRIISANYASNWTTDANGLATRLRNRVGGFERRRIPNAERCHRCDDPEKSNDNQQFDEGNPSSQTRHEIGRTL